jgi:hypothetical protein
MGRSYGINNGRDKTNFGNLNGYANCSEGFRAQDAQYGRALHTSKQRSHLGRYGQAARTLGDGE